MKRGNAAPFRLLLANFMAFETGKNYTLVMLNNTCLISHYYLPSEILFIPVMSSNTKNFDRDFQSWL